MYATNIMFVTLMLGLSLFQIQDGIFYAPFIYYNVFYVGIVMIIFAVIVVSTRNIRLILFFVHASLGK